MDRAALNALTVTQLRELATAHRIAGASKAKKADLVESLTKALSTTSPTGALQPPAGAAPVLQSLGQGSSTTAPAAPAAPVERGPEPGLPIPDTYGRDRLVLMAQDPWHVFAYWEVTPATLERVRSAAGGAGWIVLAVETPHGREIREVDLVGGNYYLTVAPEAEYVAELALRDHNGQLHTLAVSNRIRTPAAAPSSRTDEAWMAIDETFHELLDRAGLPGAGGSSAGLSSAELARRVVAWNLSQVDQQALFSGLLQRAPSSLSSHVLPQR